MVKKVLDIGKSQTIQFYIAKIVQFAHKNGKIKYPTKFVKELNEKVFHFKGNGINETSFQTKIRKEEPFI